ncbi:hypothetical protein [Paraconexibacter algicola]|uniref:Uncharacterized protein n=1 Tax=Paraconexibacter algicola TaxID=2133960 RepID=A0A2T4UE35_9ACTN|nr:hypothetical protein [Paraconexibacter algicola]PTL55784.1 hypothetical protein C7Y72_19340 [Paraconexibacter algicola]
MTTVRHTSRTRARAVELRNAGWSLRQVRELLAAEGYHPAPTVPTLSRWTNPAREEEHRRANRARARGDATTYAWPGVRSAEWRLGRMRALDAAGVSDRDIARVMTLDFPHSPITVDQVKHALRSDTPTLPLRRAAARQGIA